MPTISRRDFFKVTGAAAFGVLAGGVATLPGCRMYPEKMRGTHSVKTICSGCSVGCGISVAVKNGKVVDIGGDTGHPINSGSVCPTAFSLVQSVNSPKRLTSVKYKKAGSANWSEMTTDAALDMIARRIKDVRDRTFVASKGMIKVNRNEGLYMYAGNLTNEESYLFSKCARLLGVTSLRGSGEVYSGASALALKETLGYPAAGNPITDITSADVICIIGANPAVSHPVAFGHAVQAAENGASLITVDPRITETASLSDIYVPLYPGTDGAFINGLVNYILQHDAFRRDYISEYTDASYIVSKNFSFNESTGIFSGYNAAAHAYTDTSSWGYSLDERGNPERDEDMRNPNCVFQIMKRHYSRYTAEKVASVTGCSKELFLEAAEKIASTAKSDKACAVWYGSGITGQTGGAHAVQGLVALSLLLGSIGSTSGGVRELPRHALAQGGFDMGVSGKFLPGYLSVPQAAGETTDDTLRNYYKNHAPSSNDAMSINKWKNTDRFLVSLLSSWFGDNARESNEYCFDWLPKTDSSKNDIAIPDSVRGAVVFGASAGEAFSPSPRTVSRLEWLVLSASEDGTSGIASLPAGCEVFILPVQSPLEKSGTITNACRWVQHVPAAAESPADVMSESVLIDMLITRLKKMYREGGVFPDPILKSVWNYADENGIFDWRNVLAEINGTERQSGRRINSSDALSADGNTLCGNWLYAGCYTERKNLTERRNASDLSRNVGFFPRWSFSWPDNTRLLYNRAGVDRGGNPWYHSRPALRWTGSAWKGDEPDGDGSPSQVNPFMMNTCGTAKFFVQSMPYGPLPEFYESSGELNIINGHGGTHPCTSPATVQGQGIAASLVLLPQQVSWMSTQSFLNENSPDLYAEISPFLAQAKGITHGGIVRVSSSYGSLRMRALVTGRFSSYTIHGREKEALFVFYRSPADISVLTGVSDCTGVARSSIVLTVVKEA